MEGVSSITPFVRPAEPVSLAKPAPASRVEESRSSADVNTGTPDAPADRTPRLEPSPALPGLAPPDPEIGAPSDSSRYAMFIDAVRALRLSTTDPQPTPAEMERLLEAAKVVFMTEDGIPAEPDPIDRAMAAPVEVPAVQRADAPAEPGLPVTNTRSETVADPTATAQPNGSDSTPTEAQTGAAEPSGPSRHADGAVAAPGAAAAPGRGTTPSPAPAPASAPAPATEAGGTASQGASSGSSAPTPASGGASDRASVP